MPVEIWGAMAGDRVLYKEQYPKDLLFEFFKDLHQGVGKFINDRSQCVSRLASGFSSLHILGGASEGLKSQHQSSHVCENREPWILRLPFEVHFHSEPQWAGIRGLEKQSLGYKTPLLIDWGQTSLKLSSNGAHKVIERDYELFPVLEPGSSTSHLSSIVRDYFLDLLSCYHFDSVFLSLPVEIFENGTAGDCSVPGLGYDLRSIFQCDGVPVYVVNDAVAAAFSVGAERQNVKSLIVTLGFAMGGCLFQPQY